MVKAKFTDHGRDGITVEYTDVLTDIDQCRTFFARGRYVYEMSGAYGQREHQVCDRLDNRGNTLTIGASQDLIDVIRREYRAMRRADKRRRAALS